MKKHRYANQLLIVFLAIGFFLGIIYENLISKNQNMSVRIFQTYFLDLYSQTEIVAEDYLWYVMRVRTIPFVIFCALGYTKWRKILSVGFLCWTGFLSGILTVSAVMQLGIKGVFFCVAGLIPHTICYILAYGMIVLFFYRYPEKQWNGAKTIFVIIMMFLGVLLEVYLNPILLKAIIRFL